MTQPPPDNEQALLEIGRQTLAQQPFSKLVGAEFVSASGRTVVLRVPIRPDLFQQYGFVHGGVVSYAADNALAFAGALAFRAPVVTSEFKINFLAPARGEALIARAEAVHVGRGQAVCRCAVVASDPEGERLCATALGTIVRLAGVRST